MNQNHKRNVIIARVKFEFRAHIIDVIGKNMKTMAKTR